MSETNEHVGSHRRGDTTGEQRPDGSVDKAAEAGGNPLGAGPGGDDEPGDPAPAGRGRHASDPAGAEPASASASAGGEESLPEVTAGSTPAGAADEAPRERGAGEIPERRSEVRVPTEEDMRALGRRIAALVRPGDLLVLTGRLGAGKTTLVQGIGEGLGVDRPVTSPTFVLARAHSSGRVPLVHADAYRLTSIAELDDLDLETPAESSVTVVEWGEGMAEDLAEDRLEIFIERGEDEERIVRFTGVGRRWQGTVATGWS